MLTLYAGDPITTTRALSVEHTTIPPFWPLEECGLAPSVLVNGAQLQFRDGLTHADFDNNTVCVNCDNGGWYGYDTVTSNQHANNRDTNNSQWGTLYIR